MPLYPETRVALPNLALRHYLEDFRPDLIHLFSPALFSLTAASAEVLIFPGTLETFGQVVLEALASGLPVIVPDSGGVTDMAIPGQTGIICSPDPDSFAAAVRLLRDRPNLRRRLSTGARAYAEAHPWEQIMAQLEDYYTRAAALNTRWKSLFKARQPAA